MRFNPKARVDRSQVETRSGGGGLGGGGGTMIPIPTGRGGRVGLGTILLVIAFVVLSQCTGVGLPGGGSAPSAGEQQAQDQCRTGADANRSQSCAVSLFTTSIQDYWERAYPEQTGRGYQPAGTIKFDGSTSSGCGRASSQMGPFYCPNDQKVYLDTTFFDDMLTGELGAKGGTFAIGYVIAHEYGHHVEDLLGVLGRIRTQQGPRSDAVRVELMADCLAGAWAANAQSTQDQYGEQIISELTKNDVRRAVDAAQAVGDDRIQQRSQGRVNTDSFTHGSAAQRMRWFERGMRQGTIKACDTFATDRL